MAWPPSMPRNDATLPCAKSLRMSRCARREREALGILRDDAARDVDLLELHARVAGILDLTGNVDGPELRADHPLLHAREVRVAGCRRAQIVRFDIARRASCPRECATEIVVAIDQRRRAQDALGALEVRIRGLRGGVRGSEEARREAARRWRIESACREVGRGWLRARRDNVALRARGRRARCRVMRETLALAVREPSSIGYAHAQSSRHERLTLRPLTHADIEWFAAMRGDADIMRYIGANGAVPRQVPRSDSSDTSRAGTSAGSACSACASTARRRRWAGRGCSRSRARDEIEVGYAFAKPRVGTRLRDGNRDCAWCAGGLRSWASSVSSRWRRRRTRRSRRVMDKLGMRYEGTRLVHGTESVFYSLTPADFARATSPRAPTI